MGDHWLFEKELFYEQAIRVSLIRDDCYEYIHFNGMPVVLYDLHNDPEELKIS